MCEGGAGCIQESAPSMHGDDSIELLQWRCGGFVNSMRRRGAVHDRRTWCPALPVLYRQQIDFSGTVAELLHVHAVPVHQAQHEVRERRSLWILRVAVALELK